MSQIATGLGYPAPKYKLPFYFLYFLALVVQLVCWVLKPLVTIRPIFTPMRVALAGTYHYYSCEKAKRDFGYKPAVPFKEGVRKSLEHYSYLHKDREES